MESLVTPVVNMFKLHAKKFASGDFEMVSDERLHFFSMLPYLFVKFRGYKTISESLHGFCKRPISPSSF